METADSAVAEEAVVARIQRDNLKLNNSGSIRTELNIYGIIAMVIPFFYVGFNLLDNQMNIFTFYCVPCRRNCYLCKTNDLS